MNFELLSPETETLGAVIWRAIEATLLEAETLGFIAPSIGEPETGAVWATGDPNLLLAQLCGESYLLRTPAIQIYRAPGPVLCPEIGADLADTAAAIDRFRTAVETLCASRSVRDLHARRRAVVELDADMERAVEAVERARNLARDAGRPAWICPDTPTAYACRVRLQLG